MANRTQRSERRADSLSKQRIVAAAVQILDADGGAALTFRALAARLQTGSGAIHWHVADKGELLAAAASDVFDPVLRAVDTNRRPQEQIRAVALGVFDAIDAHPWVGAALTLQPGQPPLREIFELLGGPLQTLGIPERAQFDCGSALFNYVLGVAGQNAANARRPAPGTDRAALLGSAAAQWSALDPAEYPFLRRVAAQLAEHDDREQFLAGIDLILAGITASSWPAPAAAPSA